MPPKKSSSLVEYHPSLFTAKDLVLFDTNQKDWAVSQRKGVVSDEWLMASKNIKRDRPLEVAMQEQAIKWREFLKDEEKAAGTARVIVEAQNKLKEAKQKGDKKEVRRLKKELYELDSEIGGIQSGLKLKEYEKDLDVIYDLIPMDQPKSKPLTDQQKRAMALADIRDKRNPVVFMGENPAPPGPDIVDLDDPRVDASIRNYQRYHKNNDELD